MQLISPVIINYLQTLSQSKQVGHYAFNLNKRTHLLKTRPLREMKGILFFHFGFFFSFPFFFSKVSFLIHFSYSLFRLILLKLFLSVSFSARGKERPVGGRRSKACLESSNGASKEGKLVHTLFHQGRTTLDDPGRVILFAQDINQAWIYTRARGKWDIN